MMQVRYTKGGQLRYHDHIVNFPQDISVIATRLPRLPEEVETVIIRRDNLDMSRHVDFIVRREKVQRALEYKIAHDPNYAGMHIDNEALSQLPENGTVVDRVSTCRPGRQDGQDAPEAAGPMDASAPAPEERLPAGQDDETDLSEQHVNGVLNLGRTGPTEAAAVRQGAERVVNGEDGPIQYTQAHILPAPHLDGNPIDERTPGYIVKAFPTLFPDGAGDFYQGRLRKVQLGEYFAHLMRFRDPRFARHRRFPWFAFNTLQRHRTRDRARIFVRQQHDAARMTAGEIRTLLEEGDEVLVNRMVRLFDMAQTYGEREPTGLPAVQS